jgi:dihydropyrimidinase
MDCDLVIRGGTVVTPDGAGDYDAGVADGRIARFGGDLAGRQTLDASGALVLPGGIDLHVHLSLPSPNSPASRWPGTPASSCS